MTLDEIIHELRTAETPPPDALRAAVPHANALAGPVYDRIVQLGRGVCLMPEDENLLFHGLHVLAAARQPDLWPRLVELARVPEEDLNILFSFNTENSLAALMVSVWDGDTDGLLRLIEHADMGEPVKIGLFDVLARLTADGRVPRETTASFLERFEREPLADEDSRVWFGWEQAVTSLGLAELQPALARVWRKPALADVEAVDKAEALADLSRVAADRSDTSVFDTRGVRAIDDPAAALDWVNTRLAAMATWHAELIAETPNAAAEADEESTGALPLGPTEADWLERFLDSRQVPPTTMSMLMLDGYITAVSIAPDLVRPSSYWPLIWGEDGQEPTWEPGQLEFVLGLITRHGVAIIARAAVGAEHRPMAIVDGLPDDEDNAELAAEWAEGFGIGIDLLGDTWDPLFQDKRGAEDGLAILALCEGEAEYLGRPATTAERLQIIQRLPRILQRIAAYWRSPTRTYPGSAPVRVVKIGRNDPCPCGSGKKYKKCCALNPPPTLN